MPKATILYISLPLLLLTMVVGSSSVQGLTVQDHASLKIDNVTVQKDRAYTIPKSIVVVPIFPPSTATITQIEWYRGLYYFMLANDRRPGFTDIPFHYVVSQDGQVFEGNQGGEERKISIKSIGDTQLVVGYLADAQDKTFNPQSHESLGTLLVQLASRHGISLKNVSVSAVSYVRDDTQQAVILEKQNTFGLWKKDLLDLVEEYKAGYKPQRKQYKIEVVKTEMPTSQIAAGDKVTAKITLLNKGKFGIYQDTLAELVATKYEGASKFFLPGSWASTSQFYLDSADPSLLPGEEKTFEFQLKAPLYFGKQSEKFYFKNLAGTKLGDSDFTVGLDVKKPSKPVVQINQNAAGWYRARSGPGQSNSEVARLSSGARYIQIDNTSNGWVKLDLGGGKTGWIARYYVTPV